MVCVGVGGFEIGVLVIPMFYKKKSETLYFKWLPDTHFIRSKACRSGTAQVMSVLLTI